MGVGVVCAQIESAAAVAVEADDGCFVGGVGAAEDLSDLLIVGIEAAGGSGGRGCRGPRGVEGDGDLRGLDGAFAGAVDDGVSDGSGIDGGVEVGVDRDR